MKRVQATELLSQLLPKGTNEAEDARINEMKNLVKDVELVFASDAVMTEVIAQIRTNISTAGDSGLPHEKGILTFNSAEDVIFKPSQPTLRLVEDEEAA